MSESEKKDLRRRLSRLGGRHKPRAKDSNSSPDRADSAASAELSNGKVIETERGEAYRVERQFGLDYEHGPHSLAELLRFSDVPELAAQVARTPDLEQTSLADLVFLDTETTGLVGGAGTLIFLVGVGRFEADRFLLHQYFLRDPSEEGAMLQVLKQDLQAGAGFVTFNGRSFDLPLLEMRYVMGLRDRWRLTSWPHLDLLHPSRRLWRRELPDCRLSTLERRVLAVERTEADVPGAEIPGMYLDYLRSGDVTPLERVVYHNEMDVLSLVGLTTQVLARHRPAEPGDLSGGEALAVARWHDEGGRKQAAEAAYQNALERENSDDELRAEALRRLSLQLKRQERYPEALTAWRQWHELAQDDPRPCVELAKYYEWQEKEFDAALEWAKRALVCLSHWQEGWRRDERWGEVEHRIRRLRQKGAASTG